MRFVGSLGEVYDVVAAIPADESGESYLVRDSEGSIATLVILGARLAADDDMRARFVERRAQASRAESDAVLVSKDLGTHEGRPFLVYPFVAGVTLRQLLGALHANGRRFHPEVACALVHHLATSLDEVHDTPDDHGQPMRLAHGAVSADRVLIGFDGRVGLSGFGIARDLSIPPSSGDVRAIDSRRYAAPEVLRGEPEDTRADIYSLAIVLWESITLRKWQPDAAYVSVSELVPDAPSALDLAIAQSVSADPNRRPPSLDEFAHLLAMACPLAGRVRLSRVGDLVCTIVTPERARGRMNLPADVAERLDGARREMDPSTIEELTSPLEATGPCEFGDELGKWARVPGRASVPPPMAAGVSGMTTRPVSVRPPVNVRAPGAAVPPTAKVEAPSTSIASASATPAVEPNTRRASVPPPRASRAPAPPSVLRASKPLVPSPERARVAPAPFPAPKISPPSPITPRVLPVVAPRVASPTAAVAARAPTNGAAMAMDPRVAPVAGAAARAVPTPAPVVQTAPEPVTELANPDVVADSRLVPRPSATAARAAPMPSAPRSRTLAGAGAPLVVAAPTPSKPIPLAAMEPPRVELEVASAITARPVELAAARAQSPSVAQAPAPNRASVPPPPPSTRSSVHPPPPSVPCAAVALPTPSAFVAVPHARATPPVSAAPIPTALAAPVAHAPQAPTADAPVTAAAAERPKRPAMYVAFGALSLAAAIAMAVFHTQRDGDATATPDAATIRPVARALSTPPPTLAGAAAPVPAATPPPAGLIMPALSAGAHAEEPAPVPEVREDRHQHHRESSSARERPRSTTSSRSANITSAASTMTSAPPTPVAHTPPPPAMTAAMTQPDEDLSFRERRRLRRERRRAD